MSPTNYQVLIDYTLKALSPLIGKELSLMHHAIKIITNIQFMTIRPTAHSTNRPYHTLNEIRLTYVGYRHKNNIPPIINYGYNYDNLAHTVKRDASSISFDLVRWNTPSLVIPNCGIIIFKVDSIEPPNHENS